MTILPRWQLAEIPLLELGDPSVASRTRKVATGSRRRHAIGVRAGSVLILVVAILTLLMLLGVAFLASTSTDRYTSVQHTANTEADLTMQGLRAAVAGPLFAKVDPTGLPSSPSAMSLQATDTTPPINAVVPGFRTDVDCTAWDATLADRYPTGTQPAPDQPATAVQWQLICANPLATNRNASNPNLFPNQFRSPLVTAANPEFYSTRSGMEPTSIPSSAADGSAAFPAFRITDSTDPNHDKVVMAADADGDGIADAGLFEMYNGPIAGITYFGAVRVLDNSAAINASVAWENWRAASNEDYRLQGNFTPANVELQRLLEGPAYTDGPDPGKFAAFQRYRQGSKTSASLTPVRDDGQTPYFQWATRYDAFYFGAGIRPNNPGLNQSARYQGMDFVGMCSLTSRFTLTSPAGSSTLERFFPNATGVAPGNTAIAQAVNRQPYSPGEAVDWYNKIFNTSYLSAANRPIRPFVVTVNPVSNRANAFLSAPDVSTTNNVPADLTAAEFQRNGQYFYRGVWSAGTLYHINEWTKYNGVAYVATANHQGQTPGTLDGQQFWAEAPWTNQPVRLNPNTANFGTLYAAYWAVMADGPLVPPTAVADPEYGTTKVWTFGDVVRPGNSNSTPLPPYYVKQLRAAVAAVNTIDIRDQDEDVTSRTITMRDVNGANPITAQVYGTERQPFITEVMVHITKDDVAYVAVELHNPSPLPLRLDAFHLCYRDRDTGTMFAIPTAAVFANKSLPGFGFITLESSPLDRPFASPGIYPASIKTVAGLDALAHGNDRELLLIRTRRYDGTPITNNNHPANKFDEGTRSALNLPDLVPLDQIEFYGIHAGITNRLIDPTGQNQPVAIPDRYHYRRATQDGAARRQRQCVYSGAYNRGPAAETRRQRGFVRDPRPKSSDPDNQTQLTAPGFGPKDFNYATVEHNATRVDDPPDNVPTVIPFATYRVRSLQVNSTGMGGPWKGIIPDNAGSTFPVTPAYGYLPDGTSAPAFPFGGFARTGDLLQVPFVGGYRIDEAKFSEINSVSIDASFAEDGDQSDDDDTGGNGGGPPLEQLGRFCPLYKASGPTVAYNDFYGRPNPGTPDKPISPLTGLSTDPAAPVYSAAPTNGHRYAWAADLFEYFNVLSPQQSYYPNIDPSPTADPTIIASTQTPKWPGGVYPVATSPQPINQVVAHDPTQPLGHQPEDITPQHGLINLNTANDYVVTQLPFTNDAQVNADIAYAIVYYRQTVGPLRSLFDLQRIVVPAVPSHLPARLATGSHITDAIGPTDQLDPGRAEGDLQPYVNPAPLPTNYPPTFPPTVGLPGDYRSRYLILTRVSNMVTFHSDSFTAYLLVQGFRNAGTDHPQLVVQRRSTILIDRSPIAPRSTDPPSTGASTSPGQIISLGSAE